MEEIFWLQPQNYLIVEAIQNILAKKVTLKYSPELHHPAHPENKGSIAEKAIPNELAAFSLGLGAEVPAEITRVMLLLSADFFTKNPVPDSSHIILRILELYDFEITPQVFSQGLYSSPTAHLLYPVFGSGKVYFQGYLLNSADVHDIFSWQILSWPGTLPTSLFQAAFLGLASLIFNFIQLKHLYKYAQSLLPESATELRTENLFQEQIDQLEKQLNEALAFPQTQQKHVNGLTYQLEKLLAKFGENIGESLSEIVDKNTTFYIFSESLPLKTEYLLSLIETLSEENLILYEGGLGTSAGPSTNFMHHLWLQPYQILKNLEQIMAIATILQLTASGNQQNNLNLTENWKAAYRNQVIDVLKEAVFAELIRKTISFMYASTPNH